MCLSCGTLAEHMQGPGFIPSTKTGMEVNTKREEKEKEEREKHTINLIQYNLFYKTKKNCYQNQKQ